MEKIRTHSIIEQQFYIHKSINEFIISLEEKHKIEIVDIKYCLSPYKDYGDTILCEAALIIYKIKEKNYEERE